MPGHMPPWWYTPYEYGGVGDRRGGGLTIEDVMAGKKFFDDMEKAFKERDKEDKEKTKRKRPEPAKVSVASSFFFTLSCLMFFSIPAGMLQLMALNWFRTGVFAIH